MIAQGKTASPDDVEAFLAKVEARRPLATVEQSGKKFAVLLNLGDPLDSRYLHYFDAREWADEAALRINRKFDTPRVIAIAREATAKLAGLRETWRLLRSIEAERDELRDRLAKLEAENASLRSAVVVKPNERLVFVAPEHVSENGLLEMFDDFYRRYVGQVIVLAHDWRSIPVDELRKAVGAHIETMIVSGPGSVGIDLG